MKKVVIVGSTGMVGGIWAASNAAITIAVIGLSPVLEGEAGDAFLSASGGDKINTNKKAKNLTTSIPAS